MELGDKNENEMMKTDIESDGEDGGVTRQAQQQKYENPTPNTDTTTALTALMARIRIMTQAVTEMRKEVKTTDDNRKKREKEVATKSRIQKEKLEKKDGADKREAEERRREEIRKADKKEAEEKIKQKPMKQKKDKWNKHKIKWHSWQRW